jgi:putative heme-binding domain-containing protein
VPDDYRLAILSARPPATPIDKSLAEYLVSKVRRDVAPEQRGAAVEALTRATMAPEELIALTGALGSVSPFDLARLLPIYAKSKDQKVGLALITALTDPKVRPAIRVEQVKPILDKYPKPVRDEAEKLYALLAEARKDETAKLERLVKELPAGDVRRGQVVFNGTKAQCAACHKIGYKGGLVGPDLTRIGNIRTERDLLESIVFPSASFVRSYEPVRIVTLDGRTFSGILKSETPDEVVLTIAADKEERIPRADVESMTPSSVSVMPAGLDQQLSSQELADLVAFLKASK